MVARKKSGGCGDCEDRWMGLCQEVTANQDFSKLLVVLSTNFLSTAQRFSKHSFSCSFCGISVPDDSFRSLAFNVVEKTR